MNEMYCQHLILNVLKFFYTKIKSKVYICINRVNYCELARNETTNKGFVIKATIKHF